MSATLIGLALLAAMVAGVALYLGWQAWRTSRIAAEAERQVPPAGGFVTVAGNRIHYVEQGEGPTILFVHGLGAQLHQFRAPLFPLLPGYRLVAIDRPGSGYSTRARGGSGRLAEQARIVRGFIEARGLGRPLVVGHSLGGAVALALALDHPDAVAGLALLSPLTAHDGAVPAGLAPLHIPSPLRRRLIAATVAVPASKKLAPQTLDYVFSPQQPPADYMTAGGGWLGLRPDHIFATATDVVDLAADHPDLDRRLGAITVPVGILFGTADRVLDHKRHGLAMVGRIPGLDLELAEGVGHMPQFAVPAATAAFIRRMAAKAFAVSGDPAPRRGG